LRISAASTFSADHYRTLHEGAGVLVREDRGRIVLRGADRKAYLQGLLSNDIAALEPGSSCYATLLTAQGRMISDMRVFDLGDIILMDLESAVTSIVTEHLEKFVITEDVVVENVTSRWAQIGVYGPQTSAVVQRARSAGLAPLFALDSTDLGVAGVDLIVSAENVAASVDALERAGAVRVDPSAVEITRVEAGIPKFLVDMDSTTIPLEAGIEDAAISMSKGCYVGQEVIVRVLHRGGGRVAKRLVTLVTDGNAEPGDVISSGDREIGRVTSAVDSPRERKRLALGYVHRDFVDPGTELTVNTSGGKAAAVVMKSAGRR
jgi:folate-binding protein YgfZ